MEILASLFWIIAGIVYTVYRLIKESTKESRRYFVQAFLAMLLLYAIFAAVVAPFLLVGFSIALQTDSTASIYIFGIIGTAVFIGVFRYWIHKK